MNEARILRNISYRAWHMWRRNIDVSLVTWKTNVVPPLLEPVLYILAFGVGLGAYVQKISFDGRAYDYLTFLAPGMIAVGVMFHSIFETMYGAFIRLRYQKTFDAVITTPLSAEDILAGEILSGATKGLFAGTAILLIVTLFGLASYPSSLVILPLAALAGLMFASFGLLFAATAPYIDNLNLPIFLFINPMFLFSGTFFPLDGMPAWIRLAANILPLTHLVNITRAAAFGRLHAALLWDLLYIVVLTATMAYIAIRKMKTRLIK
ncbi:MAG: ABC transporter permease [Elusimicrobia bacterium CG08_land_8_20_14_0_20_59_10]|nr:MAG: ABC transporter permease [Elusimicrobia bacterium CG08_land_8_20_14_0_20_59_10]